VRSQYRAHASYMNRFHMLLNKAIIGFGVGSLVSAARNLPVGRAYHSAGWNTGTVPQYESVLVRGGGGWILFFLSPPPRGDWI